MRSHLYMMLIALSMSSIAKAQDTIYFDQDWNETSKANHSFYRPMPLAKVGELELLKDYYKNGNLQFQAYIKDSKEDHFVGDVYYYEENGFDSNSRQYYNESSIKELSYYNQDGSVWKKISYDENGKKSKISIFLKGKELFSGEIIDANTFSGTFNPPKPESYYDRFEEMTEPSVITYEGPVATAEVTLEDESPKTSYLEVTYWKNGQKAAESKFENTDYSNGKIVSKKHWDENGKLISSVTFEDDGIAKKYVDIDYYTNNQVAISVQEMKEMRSQNEYEKRTLYSEKGEILSEQKYQDGELAEVINYNLADRTQSTQLYREGMPYDGEFTTVIGYNQLFYTFKNGKKEGKITVKDRETNTITLYEGYYKDDLPFDGYFIIDGAETYQLHHYTNGKQEGVQKVFANFFDDEVKEEFEMKNGVLDGYYNYYTDGKLVFESRYKDGKIMDGTQISKEEKWVYRNGELVEKTVFTDSYNSEPKLIERYENNQIASVEYFNFTIAEKEQESYLGTYKNGEPYDGYFTLHNLIDDIYLVDYYEKGTFRFQYSFDILEQLENYRHYTYFEKSEIENGKIINGSEFLPQTKNGLVKLVHQNKNITAAEINIFAMHYFNRINLKIVNDEIEISDMSSPLRIKIFKEKDYITGSLFEGDELLRTQKFPTEVKDGSPNSISFYYVKNNKIETFSIDHFPENYEVSSENRAFEIILTKFPMTTNKSMNEILQSLLEIFQSEDSGEFEELVENTLFPFPTSDFLSKMEYDENGQPLFGIKINMETSGKILVEAMENGKVRKTKRLESLSALLANDKEVLQKFWQQFINEM
ncbi:hypothetical protein [Sphingobacterium hungaricum]|nr:hypothetical protein [Sphingobacterium hungaricum]